MNFDRRHLPNYHRLAGLMLASGVAAFAGKPAMAQTATLPPTGAAPAQTEPAGHRAIPSTGIIKPPATVDPGMKVKSPTMPSRSMPVIRPEQVPPNDGSVVVPR